MKDLMSTREDLSGNMIRVGFVTTSFPVEANASSGIFVKRLVDAISRYAKLTVLIPASCEPGSTNSFDGFSLTQFRYGPRKWQRLAHSPGGIPDALTRKDKSLLLAPFFVFSMLWQSVLLAGKVDVIHGNWTAPAIIGALAGKMRKTPAIATLRGEDLSRAKNSCLFRLMLKFCLKLNQRIVCVSEAMRQDLASGYPEFAEKLRFIANGVVRVDHSTRTDLREPIHLVTVGSLIKRKQVDVIISAIAEPNLRGRVRLRIIGGGPLLDQLNSLAESFSVTTAIEFLGQVAPDDVRAHLSWADFFVFASKSEGRPNAILEAMAARLPVISSDIDGVRELLLPDCGFLYPQGDHIALSNQIAYLANENDKVEACVDSALQRLDERNLTWDHAATKYMRVYQELLK